MDFFVSPTLFSRGHRTLTLLLWIGCASILSSCHSPFYDHSSKKEENTAKRIVVLIGFSGPLTGSTAHVGVDYQNGIQLAIEDMNKSNLTLGGQPLIFRLLSQNDGGDPRTATVTASFLVDKGVTAVIGHVDSGCTIAASPIYHKANVAQIAPSVSNQKYTQQGFDNTFRMMSPDTIQGKIIAKYISLMVNKPLVSIIDDGSSYGQNLSNQVENSLKDMGIRLSGHEYTYRDNVDYTAILTRVNKSNANILFFSGTDTQAAGIVTQERLLNHNILFITGDMACTPRFVLLADKASEGTFCSRNSLPLDNLPRVIKFRDRYQKRFSVPMQPYALFSYDAAMLIGDAVVKTGTLNKEKIISYLHQQESTGLTGRIAFQKNGDPVYPNVTIFRVSKNKFQVQKVYSESSFSCDPHKHSPAAKK